jgi:hypothetical protein
MVVVFHRRDVTDGCDECFIMYHRRALTGDSRQNLSAFAVPFPDGGDHPITGTGGCVGDEPVGRLL